MFILVLVPVKPNLHSLLKERARELAGRLPGANPGHRLDVVFDEDGPGDAPVAGLEARVRHTAPIRQRMIDRHLKPEHDAVLWVDADLVAYPADLPTELLRRNPGGVSAPVVLLDHHPDRFYDVAGFVEQGRWARLTPPWFDQPGPAFDLDGVGCLYLVPAQVYRTGGRHVSVPGYTDHLAVCTHARRLGMPVRAYADLRAYHAYLPDFGEPFHEPRPGEGPARARQVPPPAATVPPRSASPAGRSVTERLEAGLRLQQGGAAAGGGTDLPPGPANGPGQHRRDAPARADRPPGRAARGRRRVDRPGAGAGRPAAAAAEQPGRGVPGGGAAGGRRGLLRAGVAPGAGPAAAAQQPGVGAAGAGRLPGGAAVVRRGGAPGRRLRQGPPQPGPRLTGAGPDGRGDGQLRPGAGRGRGRLRGAPG